MTYKKAVKNLKKAEKELHWTIFNQMVLPRLRQYNWKVCWAMGAVSFSRVGDDTGYLDNRTTDSIDAKVSAMYPLCSVSGNPLWDVMSSITPNCKIGKYDTPGFDYRVYDKEQEVLNG